MKLKALKQRAKASGVSEDLLDDAEDEDDVKGAVIQLILDAACSAAKEHESAERVALMSELTGLKLVGGRLLPGPSGPASFLMYESTSGERFTVYTAKAKTETTQLLRRRFGGFLGGDGLRRLAGGSCRSLSAS